VIEHLFSLELFFNPATEKSSEILADLFLSPETGLFIQLFYNGNNRSCEATLRHPIGAKSEAKIPWMKLGFATYLSLLLISLSALLSILMKVGKI